MSDITTLRVQRETKPKIEDVLPYCLDGEMLKSALDFVAWLRANKMNPVWAGVHNQWKHTYKGTGLYVINLRATDPNIIKLRTADSNEEEKKWTVEPYLKNISKYNDSIINEGLQTYIWNNVGYCRHVLMGDCNFHGCAPGMSKTIVGKEFKNICLAHAGIGRRVMVAHDPDKNTIDCIKKLLEFERKARLDEHNIKKQGK